MDTEYVLLKDLAAELGLDKSNARKYIMKAGISMFKVRTPESRGQLTLALSPEDAETIREMRQSQGYVMGKRSGHVVGGDDVGQFYVMQLVPELEEGRVKLGFAKDPEARLASHRTAAPTAMLLRAWPCRRCWEYAAIASITREDCEALSGEVFRTFALGSLVNRGDEFFALMPLFDAK